MPRSKHVLVTGATGFVGSHLTHRLLQDGVNVTALARSAKTASARDRVLEVLSRVSSGASLNGSADRLQVLDGDITHPNLGIPADAIRTITADIDEVWHCAASLSFTEDERSEIFRMNVDGTRHVLEVVERTRGKRLHHVSTAYVAGLRDTALESEIDAGQTFRNPYEESKCRAELLVAEKQAEQSIAATVYRPSVVIGDSKTGRATHFHGVYAFIRGLWSALERLRRKVSADGFVHLPLRVPGEENTTLNFVPIDYVVNGMVEIGRSGSGGAYHLANPHPTENRVWLPHICRLLRVDGIRLVRPGSFLNHPMTKLESLFQRQMAFYYMYLQGEPRFDCTRTLAALSGAGIECPVVTAEFIEKMAGWYIQFLKGRELDGGPELKTSSRLDNQIPTTNRTV
jgi:nucleoside-diphosphate-sugar epimerase